MQATLLLPEFIAPKSEHVTSISVPGCTGNCVVVSSVRFQSVVSPVQSGFIKYIIVLFLEFTHHTEKSLY